MTMLVQRSFRTTRGGSSCSLASGFMVYTVHRRQAARGAAARQLRILLLHEGLDGSPTHELHLLSEG